MSIAVLPKIKITSKVFNKFIAPLLKILTKAPKLLPRGDRPLKMSFDEQLKALIHFHLQEHKSGRQLVEDINTNEFAK